MSTNARQAGPRRLLNGNTVRALREAIGIPQQDLALRCGLKPPYMCQIEAGSKQPSPAKQRAIADTLGVPLDAITYVLPSEAAS